MAWSRKEDWRRLIPSNGETNGDRETIYKGLIDYLAAGAYGTAFIDWQCKPVIGEAEEKLLADLDGAANFLEKGGIEAADEIVFGLATAFSPDSYLPQIACAPEVAAVIGMVAGQVRDLRLVRRIADYDVVGRREISTWIRTITHDLRSAGVSRRDIAWSLAGLTRYSIRRAQRIELIDQVRRAVASFAREKGNKKNQDLCPLWREPGFY